MSAFIFACVEEINRAYLFSDGAAYDDEGVVGELPQKVAVGKNVPIAVATVGRQREGALMKECLIENADRMGVDEFVDKFIPEFLLGVASAYERSGPEYFVPVSIVIALWSEALGAFRISFSTMDEPERPAFVPEISRDMITRGPEFDHARLADVQPAGTDIDEVVKSTGVAIMQILREHAAVPLAFEGTGAAPQFVVGGHVDVAIVDQRGARIERLHNWPDRIGAKIDPFMVGRMAA